MVEYTNCHLAWSQDFATMVQTAKRPLSLDYPNPDYPRFPICIKGVSLWGNFTMPASQIPSQDDYNNHPVVETNPSSMESKSVKEEDKSIDVHLPASSFQLVCNGSLAKAKHASAWIVPIVLAWRDQQIHPFLNQVWPTQINAHQFFYQHSFARDLPFLGGKHITYPTKEILQHCDNIDAAFRCVLYHPNLAIIFAYVFGGYLIIPICQVFGSHSAPSFFRLLLNI
jgi:hypothetical protein